MDIIKALNRRYAAKKFDTKKKLTTKQLTTIKEILRLTPTSLGIQRMKLLIIKDQKTKDKLFPYSNNQEQITTCSHLIVFTIPEAVTEKMVDDFVALIKSVRWGDKEKLQIRKTRIETALMNHKQKGNIDCRLKQQVNIALWNLLTSCAILKIDTCPIGWLQPENYDKVLWLDKKWRKTVFACALWYRAKDDTYAKIKKVRIPTKKLFEEK